MATAISYVQDVDAFFQEYPHMDHGRAENSSSVDLPNSSCSSASNDDWVSLLLQHPTLTDSSSSLPIADFSDLPLPKLGDFAFPDLEDCHLASSDGNTSFFVPSFQNGLSPSWDIDLPSEDDGNLASKEEETEKDDERRAFHMPATGGFNQGRNVAMEALLSSHLVQPSSSSSSSSSSKRAHVAEPEFPPPLCPIKRVNEDGIISESTFRKRKAEDIHTVSSRRSSPASSPTFPWEENARNINDQSGNTSKDGDNNDDDGKRKARLLRNRESAHLSRQRKKLYIDELEEKVKSLSSTIGQLNNTIAYISAENMNLRRQLGLLYQTGAGVFAPWGAPIAPTRAGSQVPLVPIPRLKTNKATPKKPKKKSDSNEVEGKYPKNGKKTAGVAVMGLFFLTFLLFPLNWSLLGLRLIRIDNNTNMGVLNQHSSKLALKSGGRVLTSWNGIEDLHDESSESTRTAWNDRSNEALGKQYEREKPLSNIGLKTIRGGGRKESERTEPLSGGSIFLGNSSEHFTAALVIPRNNRLTKFDGSLVIHSVLAGDKAVENSKEEKMKREKFKGEGSHQEELNKKALALAADLKTLSVGYALDDSGKTQEIGALVELEKALAANPKVLYEGGALHSSHSDGSSHHWFVEGVEGLFFNSGTCTEMFQFEISPSSESVDSMRETTSSKCEDKASSSIDREGLGNRTGEEDERIPRRIGRRRGDNVSYAVPLPPATGHNSGGFKCNEEKKTANQTSYNSKTNINNQKVPSSSMVVSILAGSPDNIGEEGRLSGGSKGLARIFVVVLIDSVKYVTYSCMLPSRISQPQYMTKR